MIIKNIFKSGNENSVEITGDYQFRALAEGGPIQSYWHIEKQRIIEHVCNLSNKDIVLDYGCGSGVISHFLSNYCNSVTGIDINKNAIQFANKQFEKPNLKFILKSVENIDFPPACFTKIFCLEVIEHLNEKQGQELIENFYYLLPTGGVLFLTTPNYNGLWPIIEYGTDLTRKYARMRNEQHITHYNRNNLTGILKETGFGEIRYGTYCTFAPFISILSFKLADLISDFEKKCNFPFGNLLYIQAIKI